MTLLMNLKGVGFINLHPNEPQLPMAVIWEMTQGTQGIHFIGQIKLEV